MEEKDCKECVHYHQHYVRISTLRFIETSYCHCNHKNEVNQDLLKPCKRWEQRAKVDETAIIDNRLQKIMDILQVLCTYLNSK